MAMSSAEVLPKSSLTTIPATPVGKEVLNRFNWDDVVKKTLECYESVKKK